MKLHSLVLWLASLLAAVATGNDIDYAFPTTEDPCGDSSTWRDFWINTTSQAELAATCTAIDHWVWVGNNYPGVLRLPKLSNTQSINIGDVLEQDTSGGIAQGTLTGVSLPVLTDADSVIAINQGSLETIDAPNLASGYVILTGLPSLQSFAFGPHYLGGTIRIENTGIEELSYVSTTSASQISLSGNKRLAKIIFGNDVNVTSLTLDCGNTPMPQFTGPAVIGTLDIESCSQPLDWHTAFAGLGSDSAEKLQFHNNGFSGLALPNVTKVSEELDITTNENLTEFLFPVLTSVRTLYVTGNPKIDSINDTAWPVLGNISVRGDWEGSFTSITLPPALKNAPNVYISSNSPGLNCSSFAQYQKASDTSTPHIKILCSAPSVSSSGSGPGIVPGSSSEGSDSGDDKDHVVSRLRSAYIAAIVVSVVGFLISVVLLWWYYYRKIQRRRKRDAEMTALQAQVASLAEPIQKLADGGVGDGGYSNQTQSLAAHGNHSTNAQSNQNYETVGEDQRIHAGELDGKPTYEAPHEPVVTVAEIPVAPIVKDDNSHPRLSSSVYELYQSEPLQELSTVQERTHTSTSVSQEEDLDSCRRIFENGEGN
ncbi:hypothetical protein F5884DRAFT_781876 [Xylogone sp. PMI_703]|nr:hypothetical protein F5884DRAFT_781876 [Xylogone sp. PMI_703]